MTETTAVDRNDERLALGALTNQGRYIADQVELASQRLESLSDKIDDIGVFLARCAELSEFLNDLERFIRTALPNQLRQVSADPMIGMFAGPHASALADQLETFFDQRAGQRSAAPEIESIVIPDTAP